MRGSLGSARWIWGTKKSGQGKLSRIIVVVDVRDAKIQHRSRSQATPKDVGEGGCADDAGDGRSGAETIAGIGRKHLGGSGEVVGTHYYRPVACPERSGRVCISEAVKAAQGVL